MTSSRIVATLLFVCATCASARALAQTRTVESDVERIAAIEGILQVDQERTRRWRRTWMTIQSSLLVGQLAWAALTFEDPGARAEHLLNASGSALSLLSMILLKPVALNAAGRLGQLPGTTGQERARKRAVGEELLAESAKMQAFGRGWAAYAGGLAVGLGIGLPLWLKYDREFSGAGALLGSMALTSIQAATLPAGALDDVERRALELKPVLSWTRQGLGLSLRGRW
ncbi:MAG: hypothetical protein QM778_22220 [Myxococcales bacterium]